MKKGYFHSVLLPLVIIPVGGLLTLGICYLLYLFIYNFVEYLCFATNPTSLPAGTVRRVYAIVLLILYLALFRTKISDIIKATILVGPMGIFVSTTILSFYEKPSLALAVTLGIVAVVIFLLYRYKKHWVYYYAIAAATIVSFVLAWPET